MIPESEWKWSGHVGHYVLGTRCRWHMLTRVGRFVISSVGDMHDPVTGEIAPLGGQGNRAVNDTFYETKVFRAVRGASLGPFDWEGDEIEGQYAVSDLAAEDAHMVMCRKYAEEKP